MWLKTLGLQLPSALTSYGSIDSIIKNLPKVKALDKKGSCRDALPTDAEYMTAVESG